MIHPDDSVSAVGDVFYKVVAWGDSLPAFDPLLMIKTVLLPPSSVQAFNRVVLKLSRLTGQLVIGGLVLRFATFAVPANVARVLAPISAVLHIPGIIVFTAGFRVEYVKILLGTFDFWFLYVASTLWFVVFSVVLSDIRALVVVICWLNFTDSLLQETYLRNSGFIVGVVLWEWVFYVLLTLWLSMEFVDEVHHYTMTTARGLTLSTKDLLVNVRGTMTMLLLRNVYRRLTHTKRQHDKLGTAMQSLGYRSKIALSVAEPRTSVRDSLFPPQASQQRQRSKHDSRLETANLTSTLDKRPPLQMFLASECARFDPRKTMCPRIGALSCLAAWKLVLLYLCGAAGGLCAVLCVFLPRGAVGGDAIAGVGLVTSGAFCSVLTCCCQRQLLKRVVTSFHFLFFSAQMVSTSASIMDIFGWHWIPAAGVGSSLLLAFTVLTVDALTPSMKRRLQLKFWMPVAFLVLFWLVQVTLLVDVLLLGVWDLHDRVFLDLTLAGHRAQFRVVPFLLSRVATLFVWSGRYVYVALSRQDDNALILLRGEVEFDYEGWKRQLRLASRAK
jgi:hypothetical protein